MGFQKVIILGNLGKDPEMRYTPSGKAVTEFSVAVGRATGSGDDRQEETEWFNVVAWENLAETCAKYLSKGREVLVEGRMRTRSWEKDGVRQYRTELIAFNVQFIGPNPNKDEAPAGASDPARDDAGAAAPDASVDVRDLPF